MWFQRWIERLWQPRAYESAVAPMRDLTPDEFEIVLGLHGSGMPWLEAKRFYLDRFPVPFNPSGRVKL